MPGHQFVDDLLEYLNNEEEIPEQISLLEDVDDLAILTFPIEVLLVLT